MNSKTGNFAIHSGSKKLQSGEVDILSGSIDMPIACKSVMADRKNLLSYGNKIVAGR